VAFNSDGSRLITSSDDGTVRLWHVADPRQIGKPLTGHTDFVERVVFSRDGTAILSAGRDSTVRFWDVASHRQFSTPLPVDASDIAFSATRDVFVTAGWNGSLRIWDATMPERPAAAMRTHRGSARSVIALSPDGHTLASGAAFDRRVQLWNADTGAKAGRALDVAGEADGVSALAFSPGGETLAVAYAEFETLVRLWDVASHRPIGAALRSSTDNADTVFGPLDGATSLAFRPDGETIAVGDANSTVALWDVKMQRRIGEPLRGHTDEVTSVAFAPDGGVLASGSGDGTIRLWDVDARRQLGPPLRGHAAPVTSIDFSPNGQTLVSASTDRTVRLWRNPPVSAYLRALCQYVEPRQAERLWRRAEPSLPFQQQCR